MSTPEFSVDQKQKAWSWKDLLCILSLISLAMIAHNWMIRSYPALNDLYYHMSLYEFTFSSILEGHIPHWNAYSSCGIPNLAVPINHAFSPTLVLAYTLDSDNYIHHHSLAWLVVACISMYSLSYKYCASRFGAWIASAIYLLSGPFQFYTEGGNSHVFFVGMCMLPLLLLAFESFDKKRSALGYIFCCLLMSLMFLTSHLQATYYNLLLLGLWTLARLWEYKPWTKLGARKAFPVGLSYLLIVIVGLLVSAPDWAPKFLYGEEGIELVRSQAQLGKYSKYMSLYPSVGNLFHEFLSGANLRWTVFYFGAASFVLAAAAFSYSFSTEEKARSRMKFFLVLGVLSLLIMPGVYSPFFAALYKALPGFSLFRKPTKMMYLAVFAFSILSSMAAAGIIQQKILNIKKFWVYTFCFFAMVLVVIPVFAYGTPWWSKGVDRPEFWALEEAIKSDWLLTMTSCASILLAFVAIHLAATKKPIAACLILLGACAPALIVDGNAQKDYQLNSPSEMFSADASELGQILSTTDGHGRVALSGFRNSKGNWRYAPKVLPRGAENYLPFRSVNDFSNYKLGNYARVINVANGYKPEHRWGRHSSPAPIKLFKYDTALPRFLGIQYVVTDSKESLAAFPSFELRKEWEDGTKLLESVDRIPYAYLVKNYSTETDLQQGLIKLGECSSGQLAAFVLGNQEEAGQQQAVSESAVEVIYTFPGSVAIKSNSSDPGLLIVQEAFAEGWTAKRNGVDTEVLPANGMWCGIKLKGGDELITLSFRTKHFYRILMLSCIGLVAMFLLAFVFRAKPAANNG